MEAALAGVREAAPAAMQAAPTPAAVMEAAPTAMEAALAGVSIYGLFRQPL